MMKMGRSNIWVSFLAVAALTALSFTAQAEKSQDVSVGESNSPKYSVLKGSSAFDLRSTRPRSDLWMPLASFALPGLDQWIEGQTRYAVAYTAVSWTGMLYASSISSAEMERRDLNGDGEISEDEEVDPTMKGEAERRSQLGALAWQGAGGMSAWHAFQSAARSRQHHGQYQFLRREESPSDVLLAPFNFSYLKRVSTIVPLAIGGTLSFLIANSEVSEDSEIIKSTFTGTDAFYASAFSYNAGTHEEAMFRGWIQPLCMEYWGSELWSNIFTSTLFAALHLSAENTAPVPQLLLGYHMGYVTMKNGWTIGESIFIHTWWDVMAFAAMYHYDTNPDKPAKLPILWLPPFQLFF